MKKKDIFWPGTKVVNRGQLEDYIYEFLYNLGSELECPIYEIALAAMGAVKTLFKSCLR